MSLKHDELANPNSCINKAADDEPVFVLRAQDLLASECVRSWVVMAQNHGVEQAKINEALQCARAMEAWPERKMPD